MMPFNGGWANSHMRHGSRPQPQAEAGRQPLSSLDSPALQSAQFMPFHTQQHQQLQYQRQLEHLHLLQAQSNAAAFPRGQLLQQQPYQGAQASASAGAPSCQGIRKPAAIQLPAEQSIQPPRRGTKRQSDGEQEQYFRQLRVAAGQLFQVSPFPSIREFCSTHNYGDAVRMALGKLIGEEPGLQAVIGRCKQFKAEMDKEVASIFRESLFFSVPGSAKRRRAEQIKKPARPIQPLTPHVGPNSPYWESTEARNLFSFWSPAEPEMNEDIRAVVEKRSSVLKEAWRKPSAWEDVVHGEDAKKRCCTDNDIHWVKLKSRYLSKALDLALEHMPKWSWKRCCEEAIKCINQHDGYEHITCYKSLSDWHRKFRIQGELFANPAVIREGGRPQLPPFLDANPEAKDAIIQHFKSMLGSLTGEYAHDYIHKHILPETAKRRTEQLKAAAVELDADVELDELRVDVDGIEFTVQDLLTEGRLTTLNLDTVYRWMHALGFKYEPRQKTFYVDSHQKPEVLAYRDDEWIPRYLAREIRRHQWVHLELAEMEAMVSSGQKFKRQGHHFTKDGQPFVEFHVDDHDSFLERGEQLHSFGGLLSVRMPPGVLPIIVLGQDEAIFKQFLSWWKAWSGPDGFRALWPKDDGLGVMISAIVSRELGFGVEWTAELMARVNQYRRGRRYSDEEAAVRLHGSAEKKALSSSPFVIEFEYGANNEGYWTYHHMVCQLEDCTDVLMVLMEDWGQTYEIVYMLDHSQNHNKHKPDGLNASNMNLGFGGAQPKMRDTKLEQKDCLGRFPNTITAFYEAKRPAGDALDRDAEDDPWVKYIGPAPLEETPLQIGSTQSMIYTESDFGPMHLTAEERKAQKYPRPTGKMKTKKRTNAELRADLQAKGLESKGKRSKLEQLCTAAGIPLEKTYEKIIPGWVNQPKGMLQVAFERGMVDPQKFDPRKGTGRKKYYSVDGHNDEYGNPIEDSSLRRIMEKMPDFVGEETLLQYHAKRMGVAVDHSPKAHPEVAGEGIEYDWGYSKIIYRKHPLELKRSKEKFRQLVSKCISRDTITLAQRRKFARKAREYILAYHALALHNAANKDAQASTNEQSTEPDMSAAFVEKLIKVYKTHRCTGDQEKGFLTNAVHLMKNFDYQSV